MSNLIGQHTCIVPQNRPWRRGCAATPAIPADYTEAIRLIPGSFDSYFARAVAHDKHSEFEEALEDLNEALRIDPASAKTYNSRGLVYLHLGRHGDAIADFTRALRVEAEYALPYYNRGLTYHEVGQQAKAVSDLEAYLRLAPSGDEFQLQAEQYIHEVREQR